jgi:hypothetical protein
LADNAQLITMRNDHGELSLPIFTDSDLAERYYNESDDIEEVALGETDTLEKLADVLDGARHLGIVSVVFDPLKSTGTSPRVWPIAYVAERIRNRLDLS